MFIIYGILTIIFIVYGTINICDSLQDSNWESFVLGLCSFGVGIIMWILMLQNMVGL